MKKNHFFAMLSRMRYITRWGLMRNTIKENDCEHTMDVAYIAHALGNINNKIFGGNIDAQRLAVLSMYHDVTEIITGDMPTPIKYSSPALRKVYKELEKNAADQLLSGLPEELQSVYSPMLIEQKEDEINWKYVKAADKLSALIKCIQEEHMGNKDFSKARKTIEESVNKMDLPEVKYFVENFLPAYNLTLDESNE